MESIMLVPQFPLLIVAKVQRELWPSLFFFHGLPHKLAWAYRQRECRGPREQNCRCRYGSSSHTTWWTPHGLGARGTRGFLTRHQKTSGGGSQNHLSTVSDLSFSRELFVSVWCIVILFVTLVRLQEKVWVGTHRCVKDSRLYSASRVFQLVFCWHLGLTGLSSTATSMKITMLVPQFPLLIVAKVRRELWPSLFFFMGFRLGREKSQVMRKVSTSLGPFRKKLFFYSWHHEVV